MRAIPLKPIVLVVSIALSACSKPDIEAAVSDGTPSTSIDASVDRAPDRLAAAIPGDVPGDPAPATPSTPGVLTAVLFEANVNDRQELDEQHRSALTTAVLDAFVATDLPWTTNFVTLSLETVPVATDQTVERTYLAYALTEHGVAHARVDHALSSTSGHALGLVVTAVEHTIGGCAVELDTGPRVQDCL